MAYSHPHLQACDTTTQSIAVANTPQVITFNTDLFKRKIAHSTSVNPSRFTVNETGQYDILASIQCQTTSAGKVLDVWLRVNGSDVANSNIKMTMANANDGKDLAFSFCTAMNAGDYFELIASGDSTNISLTASAAGTSPTRPVTPSILLTVSKM